MMLRLLLLMVFGLLSITNYGQSTNTVKSPDLQAVKDSLTMELEEIYKQDLINGIGVCIVNEEGTLYEHGLGYANRSKGEKYTAHTIQNIASISKTLIGIALMKAQELGHLNIDDPINQHLDFKVVNPFYVNEEITIRHLATHTSTIADTDQYMDNGWYLTDNQDLTNVKVDFPYQTLNPFESRIPMEDFLKKSLIEGEAYYDKENGFLNNKPGETFKYSNIGATLAALVIEKATGEKFNLFTKKHILDPLEMNDSGWSLEEIDITAHSRLYATADTIYAFYTCSTYPDGMLITSASDMGKYLSELVKGYEGNGTLLNKESYQELFTEQLNEKHFKEERDEGHPYNDEYNTGIFMGFSGQGYVGHAGGDIGVGTWMFFDKKTKTGRFIMKNTEARSQEAHQEYFDIWDKMDEYIPKLNRK